MISMPATALLSGAALKERRVRNGLGDAAVTGPPQIIDVAAIGLSKSYDAKAKVLDNISFAVPTGEAVALIGRNGAGKSTLLRCCVGLAKIDEVNHGAATGFGSLMFSLLLAWSVPAEAHSWRDLLVSLAVVPAAALGGYMAARLNARGARQSTKEMR